MAVRRALGLGMLIGLERERTRGEERTFAGVRTFSLVALLGATSVYAGEQAGLPWIVGVVFLAVVALVAVAYLVTAKGGSIGATTEVSALADFLYRQPVRLGSGRYCGCRRGGRDAAAGAKGLAAQSRQTDRALGRGGNAQVRHHHPDRIAAGAEYQLRPGADSRSSIHTRPG